MSLMNLQGQEGGLCHNQELLQLLLRSSVFLFFTKKTEDSEKFEPPIIGVLPHDSRGGVLKELLEYWDTWMLGKSL